MKTATLHLVTAEEFSRVHNPLADSLFAHYAHTALSTANMAHIYNGLLMEYVNPMDSVEQHVDLLAKIERWFNL